MTLPTEFKPIADFFPMGKARPAQVECLEFIADAVEKGYQDIVIAAPTGVGKSAIAAAACLWGSSFDLIGYKPGGFHLMCQKLLQDQIENDFIKFLPKFRTNVGSVKSSVSYPCRSHGTCMAGGMASMPDPTGNRQHGKCEQRSHDTCPYLSAYSRYNMSHVGVTNYSYFFTEHLYVGKNEPRNILVIDECHSLEGQILGFIEIAINKTNLDNWAPGCRPVPKMDEIQEFTEWMTETYASACKERLEMLALNLEGCNYTNKKMQDEFNDLKNHIGRMMFAVNDIDLNPDNWIYWQEKVDGEWICTARPLSAAPFKPYLIDEMGAVRIYMSAYPGPKEIFCRNLGMDSQNVAWLDMESPFPIENRPIHILPVGSMSRNSIDQTMPALLEMCKTILEVHSKEKGLVHVHSYAIGQKIFNYLKTTPMADRIIFPLKASDRSSCFNLHKTSTEPTVMVSPSITEGFSFDDDLARFQIIAKVPFLNLGDRQVRAKMDADRDWYILQAVQTILQACGRIVRCVDTETEILTTSGWKRHDELKVNDTVYGISLRAFTQIGRPLRWNRVPLETHKVTDIAHFDKQATLAITAKSTHQVITHDHTVVFQPSKIATYASTSRKSYGTYTQKIRYKVKSNALSTAKPADLPTRFTLPLAGYIRSKTNQRRSKLRTNWFWLIGFIIGDGHMPTHKNMIVIVQSQCAEKQKHCAKLEKVLNELNLSFTKETLPVGGIEFEINKKRYMRRANITRWTLSGYSSARIRDVFQNGRKRRYSLRKSYRKKQHKGTKKGTLVDGWKTPEKTVPRWCIEQASATQLSALLAGLTDSDGKWAKNSGTFYQKDKNIIDRVQEILVLIGYRSKIAFRRGQYELAFSRYGTVEVSNSNIKYGPIADVWCPSTELGTFVARRSGCTFITGNSEKDSGITYITDGDFIRLYNDNKHFFPDWLTAAFNWHNK